MTSPISIFIHPFMVSKYGSRHFTSGLWIIISTILGIVHKCQYFHEYKPYAFWDPLSHQKSTHQHFLSAKNSPENIQNQTKKGKSVPKNVDFHRPPPESVWLYTRENVYIYGRHLSHFYFSVSVWAEMTIWHCHKILDLVGKTYRGTYTSQLNVWFSFLNYFIFSWSSGMYLISH